MDIKYILKNGDFSKLDLNHRESLKIELISRLHLRKYYKDKKGKNLIKKKH